MKTNTDQAGLKRAATQLLAFAGDEKIFIFQGEMGAGKTTFIKNIAALMGVAETVSSPTFSIVNEYHATHATIYHFDFYRIKDQGEAYDIGYEEYFYSGNYCFIEWPERIPDLVPDSYIKVQIEQISETERTLTFTKVSRKNTLN